MQLFAAFMLEQLQDGPQPQSLHELLTVLEGSVQEAAHKALRTVKETTIFFILKSPGKSYFSVFGSLIEKLPFPRIPIVIREIKAHLASDALQFTELIA